MLNRKTVALALVLVLLVSILSGCAAGSAANPPARDITISVDDALAAQEAGMGGLMAGKVEWTESQFSSFLTVLLQQNTGPNMPIKSIKAWFEPDNKIFLRVELNDGVLLGGNTIDLAGAVAVADHHLTVNLTDAAANGMSVSGAPVDMVSSWINHFLADPNLGVAVDVKTDQGKLTLGLAQM
jgi:hypothetical protein